MKRLFVILLSCFMIVTLISATFGVSAEEAPAKTVYLSGSGNDENAGTEDAPVASLLKAYQILGTSGGTICLISDLNVSGEYRALCDTDRSAFGAIVLTSKGNATLTISGEGIWFPTETTIKDLHIHCTFATYNSYLVANCKKMVIGENVTVTKADDAFGYPIIYGSGFYSFDWIEPGANSDVTVMSGTWAEVYAGGGANGRQWGTHIDDVPGNATLTISGGTIEAVYGGGNGSVGGTDPVIVYGDTTVNITGGTIGTVVANGKSPINALHMGNITLNITGGTISEITVKKTGDLNGVKGKILLNCDDSYKALATNFPVYEDNVEETGKETEEQQPVSTDRPATTDAPETDRGVTTNAPETNATTEQIKTEETQKQEAGCASSTGSFCLLFLLSGAAVMLCSKKHIA